MQRFLAIFVAFGVGWLVYMIGAVTYYDGVEWFIFQPIMAALCSALFVGVALLLGLALGAAPLSRWWHGTQLWAAILVVASVFVLCYGWDLGAPRAHPAATLVSYFMLIFSISNWPLRRKTNAESGRREV